MEIIYFLVPIGILMLAVAIGLFSWAVRSDQFEDLDREGRRILFDEDMVKPPAKPTHTGPTSSTDSTPAQPTASGSPPHGTKS